jgi:hypothetical protein
MDFGLGFDSLNLLSQCSQRNHEGRKIYILLRPF